MIGSRIAAVGAAATGLVILLALPSSCSLPPRDEVIANKPCAEDDTCAPGYFCDAMSSTCVLGEAPTGVQECASDDQCGGACVDGFCCDVTCADPCMACSADKTGGSDGICGFISRGTDPDAECSEGSTCDGAGLCKKNAGETCDADEVCAGGICANGFCCETPCSGACSSCGLPGREGRCEPLAIGDLGEPLCAPYLCDGANPDCPTECLGQTACSVDAYCDPSQRVCTSKKPDDTTCGQDYECFSGMCDNNRCQP